MVTLCVKVSISPHDKEFHLSNLGLIHWSILVLMNFRFCSLNEK